MDDLSLVTNDDLIDELERRFDCMIFVGCRDHRNPGQRDCHELRGWRQDGDLVKSVGLAQWVSHVMLNHADADAAEFDD